MPRSARASAAHTWYHALNRGNRREEVVHKAADYHAFVQDIAGAHARLPVDILRYCLMPNHFSPFEGLPASLGPGLRTVSGANRRRGGSEERIARLEEQDLVRDEESADVEG